MGTNRVMSIRAVFVCVLVGLMGASAYSSGGNTPAAPSSAWTANKVPSTCWPSETGQESWECLQNTGVLTCAKYEWRTDKSAITALLLQIFLGNWGAGDLDYGQIGLGVGLLCLQLAPCCLICILVGAGVMLMSGEKSDGGAVGVAMAAQCILLCSCCATFAWNIAAIVMIATYKVVGEDPDTTCTKKM